ncbi:MMPL family transporter [Smaragdicoccus niigatensis]|uniref:MMPL family transporter n=3 Tax=Smaragdicoccus niigatensis TaxID=359359 RepID=UPI00035D6D28|nr:MMPL family transporter [Smaragdicoccus niigatensis]
MESVAKWLTGRTAWLVLIVGFVLSAGLIGAAGSNDSANQAPVSLPASADSARAAALVKQFPGADVSPLIAVLTRTDGTTLSTADRASLDAVAEAMRSAVSAAKAAPEGVPALPPTAAPDDKAALVQVFVRNDINGFPLRDLVTSVREAAGKAANSDLTVHVTGGPAFGADIADSFSGANFVLLGVTALVVAVLLIATYRSPVLWLVPLIVVALADRVATCVGTIVAGWTGLSFDGSTSGITSVLVFGAGTNYALLLVSRYREELHHAQDHRVALRAAWRHAAPAIVASNATVVLALLTLLMSSLPNIRSLGALAACGLVVAAASTLTLLPAALAIFGRGLFWPFIPVVGDHVDVSENAWHRVAAAVARRPVAVATAAIAALAVCSFGIVGTQIGLAQTDQFRVAADSVDGYRVLAQHFPPGSANPTIVVGPTAQAAALEDAIESSPGVQSVRPAGQSATGLSRWNVVLDAAPASERSSQIVSDLRESVQSVAPDAAVGGSDAQVRDIGVAAAQSRNLIIPTILLVVLAVLFLAVRAFIAPFVLVAATVLSAMSAIGLGTWISIHVLDFPALDTNVPLFAFLFLVALGVDYTIFLVSRAREETPDHGSRDGIVRAVAATGGVITSAGIVLAAVFCVLGVLPLITLTQLGIIVGIGILLDAFVVRTLVIPALFAIIGPRIWWPSSIVHQGRHRSRH